MALSRWENEGGAGPHGPLESWSISDRQPEVPQLTNTELVQLRVRVIALENLVIALLSQASDRQLERFRRSANSPSVSGDSARHAKEPTQPPPHPMSPNEARAFVFGLLDAWFQSKGIS